MRIYAGGSLRHVPKREKACRGFASALGVEIVKQGHVLLNGCRSSFDEEIARGAEEWLINNRKNPKAQILSYCLKSDEPIHNFGTVCNSLLSDWQMNHPKLKVPEQIERAAAAIFVAGNEGTYWAKNWAFYARKAILGVPRFGGAAEDIYEQELERLRLCSPTVVDDYETLSHLSPDSETYAKEIVDLAERLVIPRSVFAVMSFKREYLDVYDSYKQVCKEAGFEVERTDKSASTERIIPRIENGIRNSAFVIADVSEGSANVLYEVGFARALGKDVILTAREGTKLDFDVLDLPTDFWVIQEDVKEKLRKRIKELRAKFDR